jgi:hypothetical protein
MPYIVTLTKKTGHKHNSITQHPQGVTSSTPTKINLTDAKFSTEHISTLKLGFDFAIEHPQRFVNTLNVGTEKKGASLLK